MSADTWAEVARALEAHVADETGGCVLADWVIGGVAMHIERPGQTVYLRYDSGGEPGGGGDLAEAAGRATSSATSWTPGRTTWSRRMATMVDPRPLAHVAADGDRRATLVALRQALASQIDMAAPRDAAGLARQMQAVLREIEEIPTAVQESPADEVKRKRDARRRKQSAAHPAGARG